MMGIVRRLPHLALAFWTVVHAGNAARAADNALPAPAAGSAHLSRSSVSASADSQAMLTVDAPGRFSIRAESRTGVAFQLVDMIAGPGELAGEAGVRDARLDALLDKGTYKIRTVGAAGAVGDARLTAMPFRAADEASMSLLRGGQFSGELQDLAQRSYWVLVDKSGAISVEAVGRALADLRIWRNGTDLIDVDPVTSTIEATRGHPLLRARIEAAVEPGMYLATAYGGEALPWPDGDNALPFHIRAGSPDQIVGGAVEGVIGPFGSARFEERASPAPLAPAYVRLDLPDPAPARLSASRGRGPAAVAAIAANSREPVAAVYAPGGENAPLRVEVTGQEGQRFRLRVLRPANPLRPERNGQHLIAVDVAGEGGDDLPASAVMVGFDSFNRATVITSSLPRVGPGQAWRRKFNLRGPTDILFEVVASGRVATQTEGPGVRVTLEPLLGGAAPRADGSSPHIFDVERGWYRLRLAPVDGAAGTIDVTFGPPGLRPDLVPPSPPRRAIPLGVFDLDRAVRYQVFTDVAPGLVAAPAVQALPADLGRAPLVLDQAAQAGTAALEVPVRAPPGGAITATDESGRPVAIALLNETSDQDGRSLAVRIPAADRERRLVVSWSGSVPAEPVPSVTAESLDSLTAATPRFFDLKRDQQRSFRLDVPDGGLYRIETLGRLKTSAAVATPFLPKLAAASDNGAGHNTLLQSYLRAGSYRVSVAALESAGRIGVLAAPSPLAAAGSLVAGGSARASLLEGQGAVFAIDIQETGLYRLDLFGLGQAPTVRLEDSEGWPLTVPGAWSRHDRRFAPGHYRLVVLPQPVDTRVVARLRLIAEPPAPTGHGPHPLPFDVAQKFQWREPPGKDAERVPDRWEFELKGTAHVALDISDGMIADLIRTGGAPRPIAKVGFARGFSGELASGRYVVETRALGRNDRLDYEITLRSAELQPGRTRFVDLPAQVPFAVAEDRVVSVTTFGRTELAGVLKDLDGRVIERLGARTDDWNIALSRRLPAGAYWLELTKVSAALDEKPSWPPALNMPAAAEATEEADGQDNETSIEVGLDLPEGARVREAPLPPVDAGSLVLVAAESASELVVSLERRDADQHWLPVGFDRGRRPVVAAPADGDAARPWRATVWSIDASPAPITIATRALRAPAQALGNVTMAPLELEGITMPVRVALVTTPASALVSLAGPPADLHQGSAPGRALRALAGGLIAPQSERLWLVDRGSGPRSLKLEGAPVSPGEIALSLDAGEKATLRSGPIPAGRMRVWRAESTFGQPAVAAGVPMGVAAAGALSIATSDLAEVWNASGSERLQVHLTSADLAVRPPASIDAQFAGVLEPRTAQPLILAPGAKRLQIDLAAGAAALARSSDARPITVWSGREPVSRQIAGGFIAVVLLNPGDEPAPVSVALAPTRGDGGRLTAGEVTKRFFGAAGSLSLLVDAAPGDRVTVAGASATFVDDRGAVLRGASFVAPGPGELILDHAAGLVSAWVEGRGKSPWPVAPAVTLAAPQSIRLEGEAMSFTIRQDTPALLHARTTAPVIVALDAGSGSEPLLFPTGAELHRYVPAGESTLRVYSPHDGPLAGSLELTATPVVQVAEGLGDPRTLAPGATALFGFELKRAGNVGVGVRSQPDRATVRLLDAAGRSLGEGVAQLHRLDAGRYLVEARVPADGGPVVIRPALIGVTSHPTGPPPEVARRYLEMVGLTPEATPRGTAR